MSDGEMANHWPTTDVDTSRKPCDHKYTHTTVKIAVRDDGHGPRQTLVNTTTGEIAEPPTPIIAQAESAPEGPPPVSKTSLNILHALGTQLYGKDWDTKRHELVLAASKGAVTSSNDLTQQEAQTLINGMRAKLDAKPRQPDPMMESIAKLTPAPGAQATAELFGPPLETEAPF